VDLSVYMHISETISQNFKFSVDVASGHSLVLLWWCNMSCTSDLVYDVKVFLIDSLWQYDVTAAASLQCVYELTPLMCGNGCVS